MLSYTTLREIQKKEAESAEIVKLEKDFYAQLKEMLEKKREEALRSSSLLLIKEYENLKKIAMSIQSKREEKLMLMAIRGDASHAGLTDEESMLLKRISEIVKETRERIAVVWTEKEPQQIKMIKVLKTVERYIGLDKKVYGPFEAGQELALPKDEAEWLLKARLAELL